VIQITILFCLIVSSAKPGSMEILIASCFIFPLSALWIQSREDDTNEDEMDFL